ncbi:MAG TPA: hypothetical protein VGL93_29525 [Streptosporangiaceae bacterium]|jgi:hypothetical protein
MHPTPQAPPPAPAASRLRAWLPAPGSPVLLPWHALRLGGRYLPWLVLWFAGGQLARWVLPWLAAEIGRGSHPELRRVGVVLLFVLFLLATATLSVGMLYMLRRRTASDDEPGERFVDVLGRSLLPFMIVYVAWGLLFKDAATFSFADLKRTFNHLNDPGETYVIPDIRVAWALAGGSFLIRMLLERRHMSQREKGRPGRMSGLAAAFFETAFTLFGISSAAVTFGQASDWLSGRRAWVGASSALNNIGEALPWLADLWGRLGDLLALAKDGLILPLVWLTIAAIVYGVEVHDHREVLGGTRLGGAAERLSGMRGLMRRPLGGLSADFRDKYLPLAYAVRLVWRGGIPLFAAFALCYGLSEVVAQQAWLAATWLIGPRDMGTWHVLIVPVNFGRDLIQQVLQIAVLAAAYGLITERIAEREAERVSARAAGPSPGDRASSRS